MINPLRTLVGCAALAAGLWLVSSPAPAGTPDLPKDSYKKAADADLAFLQKRLDELAKAEEPSLRSAKPAVAATLLLAAYADALGDATFKADVLKVGEALNAKKYKDADALGKKLAIKSGTGKTGADLPKFAPFETAKDKDVTYTHTTMQLFRNTVTSKIPAGLNIEKDLKDWTAKDKAVKLDLAAVELLGVRSAVVHEYVLSNPNQAARDKPDGLKDWEKYSKQAVEISKELTAEATKKTPDLKLIRKKLNDLDARCSDCHNKFKE